MQINLHKNINVLNINKNLSKSTFYQYPFRYLPHTRDCFYLSLVTVSN